MKVIYHKIIIIYRKKAVRLYVSYIHISTQIDNFTHKITYIHHNFAMFYVSLIYIDRHILRYFAWEWQGYLTKGRLFFDKG